MLGISDGRPQQRPKLSQWRGFLAACFMFHFDDPLEKHLLRTLEAHSPSMPLGDCLVDHWSCFPVSNFRMNHLSRANASSVSRG
jgi:hypothetical protein